MGLIKYQQSNKTFVLTKSNIMLLFCIETITEKKLYM